MPKAVPLPKWRCHKIVGADRITGIAKDPDTLAVTTLYLVCGAKVKVPDGFTARGAPEYGDYFVRYEDGYQSWSPAKVFEEGYTLIEPGK